MREKIKKNNAGRGAVGRKEVALRINKSGLSADGTQRYVIAVRFTDESYKKASNTEYVLPEIDFDESRLYFVAATREEGYKLTNSSKSGTYKSITFSVNNIAKWKGFVGDYDLLKDRNSGDYYIDFSKKEA